MFPQLSRNTLLALACATRLTGCAKNVLHSVWRIPILNSAMLSHRWSGDGFQCAVTQTDVNDGQASSGTKPMCFRRPVP